MRHRQNPSGEHGQGFDFCKRQQLEFCCTSARETRNLDVQGARYKGAVRPGREALPQQGGRTFPSPKPFPSLPERPFSEDLLSADPQGCLPKLGRIQLHLFSRIKHDCAKMALASRTLLSVNLALLAACSINNVQLPWTRRPTVFFL